MRRPAVGSNAGYAGFVAVAWSGLLAANGSGAGMAPAAPRQRPVAMQHGAGQALSLMTDLPRDPVPSARALLKERDYLFFWSSRWSGAFAAQIQSVAMGWHMYALARETRSVAES